MTTITENQYFTEEEAMQDIKEALENGYEGCLSDLHNEVFNQDYYIIGTATAESALEEYGVFDAIRRIEEYEMNNFGEIYTKLSDPEKVANMLYYIIGEEVIHDLVDEAGIDYEVDEEDTKQLVKLITEKLNQNEDELTEALFS